MDHDNSKNVDFQMKEHGRVNIQLEGNTKKGKLRNSKDVTEHINAYDSILEDLK